MLKEELIYTVAAKENVRFDKRLKKINRNTRLQQHAEERYCHRLNA